MDEAQASRTTTTACETNNLLDRWFFVGNPAPMTRTNELKRCRARTYLYESLRRCMTKHDLQEAFQLLEVLPKETTFDPYALLRFILILIESNPSERINKNVIIYLEALISKLDISKPNAFVEFLAYFIRHNRIDDAKELFDERQRYMTSKVHRPLPYVDVNMRCYEFYLHYLNWQNLVASVNPGTKPTLDVSTQGWLVNAIDCLKTTTSNHEFFVVCLLRVLLFYGYYRKAYLFMSEFQRNNPNNLGAQLMHHNLLNRLNAMSITSKAENMLKHHNEDLDVPMPDELSWEQRIEKRSADLLTINNFSSSMEECFESDIYPFKEDQRRIIKNLRTLDPGSRELMELSCEQASGAPLDTLRDLLDGLEVVREISNISRWQNLRNLLESVVKLADETVCNGARALWLERYRRFWLPVDMLSMIDSKVPMHDRSYIEDTYKLLILFLDQRQPIDE